MPAPATVNEFLDLVRKSGVVDENRLQPWLQQLQTSSTVPAEPNKLAGIMIRDGLLTYFQAEQFLQGRWKRFTIGRYKVLERLGSGGMGQVFLCEHKVMRRRVAVKVLPTQKAEDPSSLERFYREARAVAALDHANIVRAYDIDQDDNLHFLVMEYVDGVSIQDVIKKFGPMDPLRTCHYMWQAAIGLQHAHENGLVHRDIKPGNVLIERQGVVKILDMGLARFFHDEEDIITKRYDERVLGTPHYLAPEQAIDSHGVDIRADIYSLGATFYYMLTGQPPFAEGTVAQKLIWHQTRQPRSISSLRPNVPAEVVAIVERMMAKDMHQRYQTPVEVSDALAPLIQEPIGLPPDREMPSLCLAAQGRDLTGGPASQATARRSDSASVPPTSRRTSSGSEVQPKPQTQSPGSSGTGRPGTDGTRRTGSPTPIPTRNPVPRTPTPTPAQRNNTPMPSPVAEEVTPPPTPRPPVSYTTGPGQDPYAPVWETLTAETSNTAQNDTDRRSGKSDRQKTDPSKNPGAPPFAQPKERGKSKLPLVIAGVVGGSLIFGAIWYFLLRDSTSNVVESTDRKLYVGKMVEGELRFPTINAAVSKSQPGDHIVILDDTITEDLITFSAPSGFPKNLTLEAGNEAKMVTWRVKPPVRKDSPHRSILELRAVEGFTLRGFVLDGQGHTESILRVQGKCPGLTLENVQMISPTTNGIRFIDASGESDRPISLNQVRIVVGSEADSAISLMSLSGNAGVVAHLHIRDCRLEGPSKLAAIQVKSSLTDFQFLRNRVASFPIGILIDTPNPNKPNVPPQPTNYYYQMTLHQNTFHGMSDAVVRFNAVFAQTPEAIGKTGYTVNGNYFAKSGSVLGTPNNVSIPAWQHNGNARDDTTKDGPGFAVTPIAATFAGTDSSDNKTFLRYDPTSKIATSGPNGTPIGFPNE